MPLHWKKAAKIQGVVKFIADIRSKPRRSPLVVQTGFPTSLADLIVKNRSRLKKSTRRKKKVHHGDGDYSPVAATLGSTPPHLSSIPDTPAPELALNDIHRSETDGEFGGLDNCNLGSGQRSEICGEFGDLEFCNSGSARRSSISREVHHLELCNFGSENLNHEGLSGPLCSSPIAKPLHRIDRKFSNLGFEEPKHEEVSGPQCSFAISKPRSKIDGEISSSELCNSSCKECRDDGTLTTIKLRTEISRELCDSGVYNMSFEKFTDAVALYSSCISAMVKVFFVVILAFVTKEIAVGVTASAFVLFSIEFAGKWLLHFRSRSCRNVPNLDGGNQACDSINGIGENKYNLGPVHHERRLTFSWSDVDLLKINHSRNQVDCSNEIPVTRPALKLFECSRRSDRDALAVVDDADLIKSNKYRNWKVRSTSFKEKFLKKFVPKKLCSVKNGKFYKKDKSDSGCEVFYSNSREDKLEDKDEERSSSESSMEKPLVNSDHKDMIGENTCREIKWNTGHLVYFVIALLGLVGGRVRALLLTIAWYLLVKSVGAACRNLKRMYESRIFL